MVFKNDRDREMYLFLCVFQQFVDKEITTEQLMQYIDEHTPPEHRNKHRDNNQTREERTAEILRLIDEMKAHIRETYFTGEEGQSND